MFHFIKLKCGPRTVGPAGLPSLIYFLRSFDRWPPLKGGRSIEEGSVPSYERHPAGGAEDWTEAPRNLPEAGT